MFIVSAPFYTYVNKFYNYIDAITLYTLGKLIFKIPHIKLQTGYRYAYVIFSTNCGF